MASKSKEQTSQEVAEAFKKLSFQDQLNAYESIKNHMDTQVSQMQLHLSDYKKINGEGK